MNQNLQKRFSGYLFRFSLTCCILWVCCLFAVPLSAQEQKITVSMKHADALTVFKEIEALSPYKFFYKTQQIGQLKNISVEARQKPIKEVLDEIFAGTVFTYEIVGEQIVVLDRPAEQEKKITVTGIVRDDKGLPLTGVSVIVKGTTVGVSTDIEGKFSLKAAPDQILQFRFLGMKDIDLSIPGNHRLEVIMHEDSQQMDEVVVTGYGNVSKASYTGSASVMNVAKQKDLPVVSLTQMMEANVTGVQIQSASGAPGASSSLRIRGYGSITASNEPLYVLDGVPIMSGNMSNDEMNSGGFGILSTLNPSDIENITILKDAASASLYGARGANGVVLITTKKGRQGKTTYNLKASYGISDFAYHYRPVMGGDERRELITEGLANSYMDAGDSYEWAYEYAEMDALAYAGKPAQGYSDWKDALFRKGHQQSYDFSVMGGSENTRFAGNLAYTKQENVVRNAGFERFSGHVNFNNTFKKWDIGMNALVSITKESPLPEGNWYASPMYGIKTYLTPSVPIRNEDGSYNTNLQQLGNINPVYENTINNYRSQIARTFASLEAGYKIIEGLRLSTVFNVDYTYTKDFRYFSPNSADGKTPNGQGDMFMVENITYNSNTRLNYVKDFGEHSVDVLAAYEIHNWDKEYFFGESKNYTSSNSVVLGTAATPVANDHYIDSDAMLSYVLRGNYDYADKYYLALSFRRDGSSRLSPDNRWNNFWAVSASWRFSRENFMAALNSWLTDAKLRASYGVNGNVPTNLYGYLGLYSLTYSYNDQPAMVETSLRNDRLSWERNYAFNIGADLTIAERVNLSFDWYCRKTKDLLLSRAVNPVTGFGSIIDNVGRMENKGIEVEVRSTNISRPNFTWTTSLNLTHNKNKVIRLADVPEYINGYYIVKEGYSLGTLALREYAGVNPDDGRPMYYSNVTTDGGRSREIIYDPNNAAVIPLEDSYPKLTGGLSNTLRYRFVDLSFNFSFSLGGYSYDSCMWALQDDGYDSNTNKSTELRRRWRKPGDKTDIPRYVAGQEFGGWWHSSRGIHSTDHLRLKSLVLGLNAPENWLQPLGFSAARVYFSGTNLLTWARYDQYDPELSGVVGFSLPPLKTWAFGVEISF